MGDISVLGSGQVEKVMSKLLYGLVAGLASVALTGCDIEIIPMPAGAYGDDECYDCGEVVDEVYVGPPDVIIAPPPPAYVVDTYYVSPYVEEAYVADVVVEDPAVYGDPDAVYVEGDYVAGEEIYAEAAYSEDVSRYDD